MRYQEQPCQGAVSSARRHLIFVDQAKSKALPRWIIEPRTRNTKPELCSQNGIKDACLARQVHIMYGCKEALARE